MNNMLERKMVVPFTYLGNEYKAHIIYLGKGENEILNIIDSEGKVVGGYLFHGVENEIYRAARECVDHSIEKGLWSVIL